MLSARVARAGFRATQFSVPRTAALNGLRAYATPAQDVKPPVSLFGVDGTYATALVCDIPRPSFSPCLDPGTRVGSGVVQRHFDPLPRGLRH